VKRRLEDLAIFGGAAAFPEPLLVGRPNLGDRVRLLARLEDMLDRRWLSNDGPYLYEFEERVAAAAGVRHCVAMVNGTVGLEIVARACGLSGEVIVPAFTFIATAHALQWQQITPVFCDIDERTHNIDPARVEALITPRTTGILAVHVWGRPAPIEELAAIAGRHGLKLVFDASHAVACTWRGRPIGGFGDAEVFSFHATKLLNTFEGGAVVTDDGALAARLRSMRNFGFSGYDEIAGLGINGKMNEASAIMGLTCLEDLDGFIATNRRHYHAYRDRFAGVGAVQLCEYDERESCNYQYVVLELSPDAGLSRDQLVKLLVADGIVARRYFYPGCHRAEPYRSLFPGTAEAMPITDRVAGRVVVLPTGAALDETSVARVAGLVRFALANAAEISRKMGPVRPAEAYEAL
jgi:dTDP-4-amino-4,6-dideoxygalactose transaminase